MWFAYLAHRFNTAIASLQNQGDKHRSHDQHPQPTRQERARSQPKSEAATHPSQRESNQSAADNLDKSAADVSTLGLSSFFDK